MKNYLKACAFRAVLTLSIIYLSANYLQIELQTPWTDLRSPVVISVVYEKNIQPRLSSMEELKNGSPIQDETEVSELKPIPIGNVEMNNLFAKIELKEKNND